MSTLTADVAAGPPVGHGTLDEHDRKVRLAALLLICSDVVFVAALLFAYLYLRSLNVNGMWRPPSVHPVAATQMYVLAALLVVSTAAYRYGLRAIERGTVAGLRLGLGVALAFWVAELVVQLFYLARIAFQPSDGAYAAAFYVLTGYHVFHLVLGLLLGVGLLVRAARGRFSAERHFDVACVGYFWVWATVMAVIMAILPT